MHNPFTPAQWHKLSQLAEEVVTLDGREVTHLLFPNGLGLSIAYQAFNKRSEDTAELAALKHGCVAYGPLTGDIIPWATFDDTLEAARSLVSANPVDYSWNMPSLAD